MKLSAKDGEKFWRMKEVYIRGNTIKYVRVPDDTLGKAVEDNKAHRAGAFSGFSQALAIHACAISTTMPLSAAGATTSMSHVDALKFQP
jgi:hypothetical protein